MPNLLTLMAKYGLSAGENVSGEITAIWNSEKTPEVILKNASVINVSATQNVTVKKMLTEKLEEGQVSDNAKVFSAVAYKNNAAKLVWITGSDTMTLDDPKLDYMVLLYHFNNLLAGTTSSSGSQQSGVGATNADVSEVFLGSVLASDQGAVTFWGIVFVLIIPTCVCGVPFLCIYKRKKNNKPQTDEN